MRVLRGIALTLLAALALVAASAGVLWGASLAGLARAEVAGTSAMAPQYAAGDLLIVTRVDAADIEPGDVLSVPSGVSGGNHLARVDAVERAGEHRWAITATAGSASGPATHETGAEAWAPSLRIPVVGGIVMNAVQPAFAIPLAAVVLLLVAVALVGRAPGAPRTRTA